MPLYGSAAVALPHKRRSASFYFRTAMHAPHSITDEHRACLVCLSNIKIIFECIMNKRFWIVFIVAFRFVGWWCSHQSNLLRAVVLVGMTYCCGRGDYVRLLPTLPIQLTSILPLCALSFDWRVWLCFGIGLNSRRLSASFGLCLPLSLVLVHVNFRVLWLSRV